MNDPMTPANAPELVVTRVDSPDEEAAFVTLSSGAAEVVAFCHPCELVVGSRIPNRLWPLDVDVLQAAYLDDWPEEERAAPSVERLEHHGHARYSGVGQVIDAAHGRVLVRGFVIEFGEALADVRHVEFDVTRLDCAV
ncbi:hypothetical protein [Roseateles sp. L2-2]|uniref:hypothetical protein n=1 Tax=Roseateles sp. L2-2 TaxID=3422597 RepID=UPI003D36FF7E